MKNSKNHPPPLAGIKVLDLSRILPGPFATMILGDLGCELIHVAMPKMVDPLIAWFPKGPARDFLTASLYRGKQSVVINFKKKEGRDLVLRLAAQSDVFVEGFRPGALEKAGLGYKDIAKINPRLIYCSISGYGQTGPRRRWGSHDINYLALSGFLSLMPKQNGALPLPPLPIGDLGGGSLYAVISILAALHERGKSGKGQYLDVSITDGLKSWMLILNAWQMVYGNESQGSLFFGGNDPFYRTYKTQDDRFIAVGAVEPGYRQRLLHLMNREDLNNLIDDKSRWQDLANELEKTFRTKPLTQWQKLLEANETCATGVLSIEEAMGHSAAAHPFRFSRSQIRPKPRPFAPGQDTKKVLAGLKFSRQKLKEYR